MGSEQNKNRHGYQVRIPSSPRQHCLLQILSIIQAGNCCLVLGPRFQDKSQLMKEAATRLHDLKTHRTAYLSLAKIQTFDEAGFFSGLHTRIRDGLGLTAATKIDSRSALEFQLALVDMSKQSDWNLAVFIDDLEIAPPNLVASLLGALRAVFSTTIYQSGARFQAIVCGSLNLNQVALDNASRFEGISQLVLVGTLDEQERKELAYGLFKQANLTPTAKGIDSLLEQTCGDSLLIRHISEICIREMRTKSKIKVTKSRIEEAITQFLKRPLSSDVMESIRQMENNPNLLSSALLLLEKGEVPSSELPIDISEIPTALDLCTAFDRPKNDRYKIKSPLWENLLRRHFTQARIGGLYAIAGDWVKAINHLGIAFHQGEGNLKPGLFTATINAINASKETDDAFLFLVSGLQAIYFNSELRLYRLNSKGLILFHPQLVDKSRQVTSFRDTDDPLIKALDGPDYSVQESRLMFPLRAGEIGTTPIGLVSFSQLVGKGSIYERREERVQLARFLRQAAVAIETKVKFLDLLSATELRADKLNILNRILAHILHHRNQPEETIWKVFLEAVTHGWGLGYNRAILFVADSDSQELVGHLGVGQLTQKDANAEWYAFPFDQKTLDNWLDSLFIDQWYKTERYQKLQRDIEGIRVSLNADPQLLLSRCFLERKPFLSSRVYTLAGFPRNFSEVLEPPEDFALIPLRAGEQILGVLYVDNKFTGRLMTTEQFELLQSFVNQASLIIENARAFTAERKQTKVLTKLLSVEEKVNSQITQSVKGLYDEIVQSAQQLFNADCVVLYPISAYESGHDGHEFAFGDISYAGNLTESFEKPRLVGGIAAWVIEKGFLSMPDVASRLVPTSEDRVADSSFIFYDKVKSFAGVRLGPKEMPVGVLYMNWRSPRSFEKEEQRIIKIFANFVAVAIPSARRYQHVQSELQRRTQELRGLIEVFDATLEVGSEDEIEYAIQQALLTLQKNTEAQHLHLVHHGHHDSWRYYHLTPNGDLEAETQYEKPAGFIHQAFVTHQPNLATINLDQPDQIANGFHPDARCVLIVPVLSTGNNCLAVIWLESPDFEGLTTENQAYAEYVVGSLAVRLQQIDRAQSLRRLLDIAIELTEKRELQEVLTFVVERAMAAMRIVSAITLYYVEKSSGQLLLGEMAGLRYENIVGKRPPYKRNVVHEQVWNLDTPVFAQDVSTVPLLQGPFIKREKIVSVAAFPLKVKEERVGCMFFNYRMPHVFDDRERNLITLFAQLTSVAIHQANLDAELQRARERELWDLMVRLSTGLIHDINSAVANIPDLISEIQGKMQKGSDISAPLSDLSKSAERTGRISSRLHDFAFQKKPFRPQLVQLDVVIRTVINDMQEIKPAGVTLKYEESGYLTELFVDRLLLELLLQNLIANAFEAIPLDRDGIVEIRTTLDPTRGFIHIKDNGRGIASKDLPRVFDADYTTKKDSRGLHGIGLKHCLQIAKEHQGDIKIKSEEGIGTLVTVIIPQTSVPYPRDTHHEQQGTT
jgi:signal transduction histidine kinase